MAWAVTADGTLEPRDARERLVSKSVFLFFIFFIFPLKDTHASEQLEKP